MLHDKRDDMNMNDLSITHRYDNLSLTLNPLISNLNPSVPIFHPKSMVSINIKPSLAVNSNNENTVDHFSGSFNSSPFVLNLSTPLLSDESKVGDVSLLLACHSSNDTSSSEQSKAPSIPVNLSGPLLEAPSILNPNAREFYPEGDATKEDLQAFGLLVSKSPMNENSDVLPHTILQSLRLKNVDKIIIGHININSIRNKIHLLADIIRGRVDILLISETKLDSTFPKLQFCLHGFS